MTEPSREEPPEPPSEAIPEPTPEQTKRALVSMVVITIACVLGFGAWRLASERSASRATTPHPVAEAPSAVVPPQPRPPDIILGPRSSTATVSSADVDAIESDASDASIAMDAPGAGDAVGKPDAR